MKKLGIALCLLLFMAGYHGFSQENYAINIGTRFVQEEIMYISYDILDLGDAVSFHVKLTPVYLEQEIDVTEAYGDIGAGIKPGKKEIVWYFKSDFPGDINEVEINIHAYKEPAPTALGGVVTFPSHYKKHKTMKNIWMGAAIGTGAVGGYALLRSNSVYNDYKTARADAEDLRKQYETLDKIYPAAFVLCGVSATMMIIQMNKQKKAGRGISFHIVPFADGMVAGLSWEF